MLTLNDALQTGNFSVLRERGSPNFQATASADQLAQAFAKLRAMQLDLDAAVSAALERAEITELADRSTATLSGGEWQRARVARALAQEGEALVLDEPSTFLDVAHEMALFELLAGIASSGHAVLLVSHQLNLVARFADRLVLLDGGQVAATGTPAAVMDGPTLERVYRWPLVVTRDPAVGSPTLVPLRRSAGAAR